MPIPTTDKVVMQLMKLFGIPDNCSSFVIRADVGEMVRVDCTFLPDALENGLEKIKHYTLEEITEEKG